jgi:hypothetical protein
MKKAKIKHSILLLTTLLMLVQLMIGNAYAIKHGAPDEEDHPYVCWIVTWDGASQYVYLGTGALIASDVVLTAGHITHDAGGNPIAYAWVSFSPEATWRPYILDDDGNIVGLNVGWYEVETWETYPYYRMGGEKGITDWIANDVGILTLYEPVSITPADLPTENYVDTLPMKQKVDLVGYGVQYKATGGGMPPGMDWIDFGYRYAAYAQIIATDDVFSDGFMRLTANPGQGKGGTCFGDSGSPILEKDTDTILGVCSWGTNGNCAGVSYEQRIDTPDILTWITSFVN